MACREQPLPRDILVQNREEWAGAETDDRGDNPNDPEFTRFTNNEFVQPMNALSQLIREYIDTPIAEIETLLRAKQAGHATEH